MKAILTISRLTLKEYYRRKVLIVTLLSMLLLGGTGLLSNPFTLGLQTRFMRDMALLVIQIVSLLFSLSLAATLIPNEIERKTLHVFLAKPMPRIHCLLGKFLAVAALVALNDFVLGAELIVILMVNHANPQALVPLACSFIWMESLVIASIGLWISTFASAPVSFALVSLLYILGSVSHVYALVLTIGNPVIRWLLLRVKSILPYFDYFSIRGAVVQNHPVPLSYIGATALYGLLYIILALLLSEISFARKDL